MSPQGLLQVSEGFMESPAGPTASIDELLDTAMLGAQNKNNVDSHTILYPPGLG